MFSANQTPRLDRGSRAAELGQQWIREHQDFRRRFVAEQRTAADHEQVKSPLSDPPDVLVVIVECLRDDALSPLTAPHLMHWSRRGLRLRQHYSTGNASNLGFFGIMFGLDAIWFGDADELPIRMCAGLRQYGYQTGFFRP